MAKVNTEIKLPESGGQLEVAKLEKKTEEKFKNMDLVVYTIVVALLITTISALISVGAIVIDQLHFNNQTYRNYSDIKNDNVELLKKLDTIQIELNLLKNKSSGTTP